MPFARLTEWDTDTMLWALQVYDDVSEYNNGVYKDIPDPAVSPYEQMGPRWGRGLPDHMAYQSDPCGILKAADAQFKLHDRAWLDWSHINNAQVHADSDDTERDVHIALWVTRSYGTGPVTPPYTQPDGEPCEQWLFLGSFSLSEEQECPWCGPTTDPTADTVCPLCGDEGFIHHGSGYALQVWGAVVIL